MGGKYTHIANYSPPFFLGNSMGLFSLFIIYLINNLHRRLHSIYYFPAQT